jgi:H/ACA ribonucleoprotein complex subunit 2
MAKDKEHKKEKSEKRLKKAKSTAFNDVSQEPQSAPADTGDVSRASIDMNEDDLYESKLSAQVPFAKPLASKKLNKKVLKTIKKGSSSSHATDVATQAKELRRGVKEVVKALRKGEKGLVVIAGDISPEDVISHLPVLCEDHSVPYIFTPSKLGLGLMSLTNRPTSVVLVKEGGKEKERVEELAKEVRKEMKSVVHYV